MDEAWRPLPAHPAGGAIEAEESGRRQRHPSERPGRPRDLGIARRPHGKAPPHDGNRAEEVAERAAVKGNGGHGFAFTAIQEKCVAVFRPELRQNKYLARVNDSEKS